MSLKITTPVRKIEKSLAKALRDAMDCPEFTSISFYHYISDDDTDEFGMNERISIINRPKSVNEIDEIARKKAQELTEIRFTDSYLQGYESIVTTVEATDKDGVDYNITEQIIGDSDGYEWEIEYVQDF